jgi:hypothetical protein
MKKIWLAGLGFAALSTATIALAQTAPVAPTPAAPARAPAPATAPAAPAPAAPAPATPAPAVAAPAPAGDWTSYSNPYSGEESDVKNPNRTQEEIIDWSRERATDVLSFSPADLDAKLTYTKKGFTAPGWAEYTKYLQDSKLTDMVKTQGYSVTTIVNGDPLILNSGSMAGNYHWLVELPLMVTFLHTSQDGAQQAVAGGDFKLLLQLGRVPAKDGIDGMQIESWKMENKPQAAAP